MAIKWRKSENTVKAAASETKANGESWKVTFSTGMGSDTTIEPQTVGNKKKAKEPEEPKKDGFTFGGWFKDDKLTEAYNFNSPVTADITLYAKWTENAPTSGGNESGTNGGNAGGEK